MDNYNKLIEMISENSEVSIEELERKVAAKQAKLSGLISKEGAAQVIAAELGINFEKEIIKISHILPGMKKINIIGKIINLFPIREYNKNGKQGRVLNFTLADETSNVRCVLWDENHIDLFAKNQIKGGDVVEISNAGTRNGELHLNSFSEIKLNDKNINNVITEKPVLKKTIESFNPNEGICTRAFIVQFFEPRFFEICPECRKKVNELKECQNHGKIVPEKRALLNFVIDDGTDSIRAVIFSDNIEKIMPLDILENSELFSNKKNELLGKELFIQGDVRKNQLYGNKELIVSEIKDIDLDKLIEELEN